MKNIIFALTAIFLLGCQNKKDEEKVIIEPIATFTGQQVTGVTVSTMGRIFANFPRWRKGVANSVVTLNKNGEPSPYPDTTWNSWEIGQEVRDSVFIGVQSVIAHENSLYVLDTRNPLFKGVVDAPRLFVFDLTTNALSNIFILDSTTYHPNSYINDLRVDAPNHTIYMTDSGKGGLVILDTQTGTSRRMLNDHVSTTAETDHLTIDNKRWENTVHSDGIALDLQNNLLYYHSLTGYTLYAIPTNILRNGTNDEAIAAVRTIAKTSAPDGMIMDGSGTLYYGDLEHHKINYLDKEGTQHTLHQGDQINWPDTFSIYDGYLYYTNSRIHEAQGDIASLEFSIYKIQIEK
ncbi:L-dopachrome tautomerase-related protein [Aquimarina intermedia]|uniref:Major royal jelly protein n=1 Tax=Aquimarina intermedia TaxID=350814 RepID=A0A5S5BW93_9FLAO|nr:L-dopachrome tautomerase-related protein [Aquimarina intermedia]TYP70420.1 major royal jelly protein [Aquimarina intermedia]